MPIYLVRWPALRVSLIRASNEQHLVDILDEIGDPGGCRWMVYKGPLWFDLELPVNLNWDDHAKGPRTDADVQIEGVDELKDYGLVFKPSLPLSDTAGEMGEAVARSAFPHLNRVFNEGDLNVMSPPKEEIIQALQAELRELLQYYWRAAQMDQRTHPESALLRTMGLTVVPPWLKRMIAEARRDAGVDDDEE
jgi:hypothetical protein